MLKKVLYLSASFALAAALATPSWAQEAQAEEDQGGIREILVTAQRREENIQSVPVAVTALDAEALSESTVKDIRDIAGRVPSLVVDNVNAGPSAAAISIRGISFEDIEKSFDPAVGVVLDGVFSGTNTGQLLDAFDMESIEVLRGPQGTLFGRNTIGGVINIRRSKPTGEFGVKASLGYADFGTWRGRLVVNTPMIGDFLAIKGFFNYDKTDGYLFNATQNRRAGKDKNVSFGATARIEASENISAQITYQHSEQDSENATAILSRSGAGGDLICILGFAPPSLCNRPNKGDSLYTIFGNIPTPITYDTDAVTGEINAKFGDWSLVSITGWQKSTESVTADFDSAPANFFDAKRDQDYDQFSHEVRLVGDLGESVNLLLGAYYFESSYFLNQATRLFTGGRPTQRSGVDSKSYAAFGDVKIKPSDLLTIGLGGRYTRDKKSFVTNYGLNTTGVCPTTFGGGSVITAADCVGKLSNGKFTWKASADYEIGDNKLLYASYSTGYRSGSFNGRAATPAAKGPYEPETVKAYEVGIKADWLDRILRTNLALFRTDYANKQEEIVQPTPAPFNVINVQQTIVSNAASARINGIELEVTMQPSDNFTVNASMSYLDAKYRNFRRDITVPADFILDDVSTLDLRRAPKYTWSVSADWKAQLGSGTLILSPNFRFIDKYATCIIEQKPAIPGAVTNDFRCISDAREILDVTASYLLPMGDGEMKFSVFARNLLDDRGTSSTLPVAGLFTFAGVRPPRQFGAEVQFKF